MVRLSPLPQEIRIAILDRFRISYSLLTGLFALLSIGALAWQWNQPGDYYIGVPYTRSIPVLLIAAILVTSISFYFQNRYVHRLLQRSHIVTEFGTVNFALRFYLYNLVTAIVLSIVCFIPLLILLFFFWIYPVILWLIPYHLISGAILGWNIRQSLNQYASDQDVL
jgi:hypothetical protein